MRLALLLLLLPLTAHAREAGQAEARVGVRHAQPQCLPLPGAVGARVGLWQPALRTPLVREEEPAVVRVGTAGGGVPSEGPPPGARLFVAGRDSLPDGMPLLGRALWGRHGLMRTLGLAPSSRRAELRVRRRMLQAHQKLALVTLGVFTGQVVVGEMLAADPARYHDRLRPVHLGLGYTTFGLYATTASFSLFAPPARRYTPGFDAVDVHRALAVVHFTGMMLMPWLGRRTARGGPDYDRHLAQHRWVGRVTYGAYLGAFATILLAR